jgi:hypothetical protein
MTSLYTHFSCPSADLDSPWHPAILIEAETSALQWANMKIMISWSIMTIVQR